MTRILPILWTHSSRDGHQAAAHCLYAMDILIKVALWAKMSVSGSLQDHEDDSPSTSLGKIALLYQMNALVYMPIIFLQVTHADYIESQIYTVTYSRSNR